MKKLLQDIKNRCYCAKNGRLFVTRGVPFAHIVWNTYNSDNKINKGECIHHIDRNICNDDISNLRKMTLKEHMSLHKKGIVNTEEYKKKMSESLRGRVLTEEHKNNISLALRGKKQRIDNMKKALKGRIAPNKGKPHSLETRLKISEKTKGRIPWNKGKTRGRLGKDENTSGEKMIKAYAKVYKHIKYGWRFTLVDQKNVLITRNYDYLSKRSAMNACTALAKQYGIDFVWRKDEA